MNGGFQSGQGYMSDPPLWFGSATPSTLSDTFTDTPGTNLIAHTPNVGGAYHYSTPSATAAVIDSSGTEMYFPAAGYAAYNSIIPASPNYYVEGVIDVKDKGNAEACVVIARMSGAGGGGYGFGLIFSSGAGFDGWVLYDIAALAFNQLDQGNTTLALGLNTVRITVSGTTVTCSLNGSVVSTTTQTTYSAAGVPGIGQTRGGATDTTGFHISNLVCNP